MSTEWHYTQNGEQSGPVSSSELKHLAISGTLNPTDVVWKEGMAKWVPAARVKGLFQVNPSPTSASGLNMPPPLPNARAELSPPENELACWFYSRDGRPFGPVTTVEFCALILSGDLTLDDMVCKEGMQIWVPAESVREIRTALGPAPLGHAGRPRQEFIWTLAFAPLISTLFLEPLAVHVLGVPGNIAVWINVCLNIGLCAADEGALKKAGYNPKKLGLGSVWLVPVYLYRRGKVCQGSDAAFATWMFCFFISLCLVFARSLKV